MSDLRAGYGACVITPPPEAELTGFGYYLHRRAARVVDDLQVRAVALAQGETRVVLISCDLLGFTVAFSDGVRAAVAAACGVPATHVFLACTHTHTGPVSQPLFGLGEIHPTYHAGLPARIAAAARTACDDLRDASLVYRVDTVEPIGHNRRLGGFDPIDPTLKVAVLTRDDGKIYLLNYGCHPVTYGAQALVSADWPGATCRALEADGHRAVVFQGFAGDINPVNNKEHWGHDAEEVVALSGHLLARRALLAERHAAAPERIVLRAAETRIDLPLAVPTAEAIAAERDAWLAAHPTGGAAQFITEWATRAFAARDALAQRPVLAGIPITAVSLGAMQLLGLPGEIFCTYGLRLRETYPNLFPCGHAGGNIGYFPTADAYAVPNDYACCQAPRFYTLFPFTAEIEGMVLAAAAGVLSVRPYGKCGEKTPRG